MRRVPDPCGDSPFMGIYESLSAAYGPRRWWPVTPAGGVEPEYTGGPSTRIQMLEVAVGAVLTQNTSWKNASKAIANLNRAGLLNPEGLTGIDTKSLAGLIRPSGYFNQKAERIKVLAAYLSGNGRPDRDGLLELEGIGPETADSIMLYGYGELHFVVDAYTRRIFGRIGLIGGGEAYEAVQLVFESNIPPEVHVYQEYHALIVEHGKRSCTRSPDCGECVIGALCGRCGL